MFNIQKLDSINSIYIKEKPINALTKICLPYLSQFNTSKYSKKNLEKIIEICQPRLKKLSDVSLLCDFFFQEKLEYDKDLLNWKQMEERDVKESLKVSENLLSEVKKFDKKTLEEKLLKTAETFNKKKGYPERDRGYLLWPLRVALSGKEASAGPFEIAEILGKQMSVKRIQEAISMLAQ